MRLSGLGGFPLDTKRYNLKQGAYTAAPNRPPTSKNIYRSDQEHRMIPAYWDFAKALLGKGLQVMSLSQGLLRLATHTNTNTLTHLALTVTHTHTTA